MSDTEPEASSVEYLHDLATHFAMRDWVYTRDTGIKHIRYFTDTTGHNRFRSRLAWALRGAWNAVFGSSPLGSMFRGKRLRERVYWPFVSFMVRVRKGDNRPDGSLNNGSVITHWEEDGEYIQLVQPSVGVLLADFLKAEPDNPHAVAIIAELDRIIADYEKRARHAEMMEA